MNLREQILATAKLEMKKVFVKAWNTYVFLKPLSIKEHEKWEKQIINDDGTAKDNISLKASMVIASCYDEAGNKLFEPGDIEALGETAAEPINKLFAVCSELNAITSKDIDELEGNSEATKSGKP